jgi:hypothetical protein
MQVGSKVKKVIRQAMSFTDILPAPESIGDIEFILHVITASLTFWYIAITYCQA